ncbi:MAG: leucyl aminopeptidase family protein [Phenylobacterium sp.]|nr:leucyl aminopeptidase family protein [Phenylobacterium sp.]
MTGLLDRLPVVTPSPGEVSTTTLLGADDVDALVLPVAPPGDDDEGVQPRAGTVDAAVRYGLDLARLTDTLGAQGKPGELHVVPLPRAIAGAPDLPWAGLPTRLVVVGVGQGTPADLRRAGAALARATRRLRRVVTTVGADAPAAGVRALVEGYLLGAYRHPSAAAVPAVPGTDGSRRPDAPADELVLLGDHDAGAVEDARRFARVSWVSRALSAVPSSVKSPAWVADRAVELGGAAGLRVEVLGPVELERRGFGGILAVGRGSAYEPRLVVARYEPAQVPASGVPPRHVVVVGKGITYDTGGLSIKPREAMVPMKTDMTGAAVALATVLGAAEARVAHRVTAVLPLAENAVDGASWRPGDVVRTFGGTTVEIANTDAEGRMVLADGLAYADAELDPDVLVDVATLTGAATLGLGRGHGALYTHDDALARAFEEAGGAAGEPLWRMPLVADYRLALRSDVADVRHVPADGWVGAGSITAALFLERFAGSRRWVHLDIAGPARATAAKDDVPEGATGFGARALLEWLTRLG